MVISIILALIAFWTLCLEDQTVIRVIQNKNQMGWGRSEEWE